MKKSYVKPVMESEAFVANEYVGACWKVTCTIEEHGSIIVTEEPTNGVNGFYKAFGQWFYDGIMNGHEGFIIPHPVTITKKGDGTTANAS